jgi:hypothetical protein
MLAGEEAEYGVVACRFQSMVFRMKRASNRASLAATVALLACACSSNRSPDEALAADAGHSDAGNSDAGGASGGDAGPTVAGCRIFPPDSEWNRDVSGDPVDLHSADYLAHLHAGTTNLHADFGSNPLYGQPVLIVSGTQARQPMTFLYAGQSDPGPYPFPPDIPIQGGQGSTGDRHAVALDKDSCVSYETYLTYWRGDRFDCGSGAIFDLRSSALRPDGWTSATASGLPIISGMARYGEVALQGELRHALTFTAGSTAPFFVHPATHQSGTSNDAYAPPMGLRVRLRADYDLSRFHGAALVILRGLARYGMFVGDNGSDWFIDGEKDSRWDDVDLDQLKTVPGSAFEVIRPGPLH